MKMFDDQLKTFNNSFRMFNEPLEILEDSHS